MLLSRLKEAKNLRLPRFAFPVVVLSCGRTRKFCDACAWSSPDDSPVIEHRRDATGERARVVVLLKAHRCDCVERRVDSLAFNAREIALAVA